MTSIEKTELLWHDATEAPTQSGEYIAYDKYAGGIGIYEYSAEENKWLYYVCDEVDYPEDYTENVVCWAEIPEIPAKYRTNEDDLW